MADVLAMQQFYVFVLRYEAWGPTNLHWNTPVLLHVREKRTEPTTQFFTWW